MLGTKMVRLIERHSAALSEGGFSMDDLKEIALQQAVYCGVPAARTAFEMLQGIDQGK